MRALRVWLVCLLGLLPGWVLAQTAPDVRIVVDVSGSMKQNDPGNLRANALDLAAILLPQEARGSIWTFGTTVANPVPDAGVDDAWRQRVSRLMPQLTDYQQFTDIEQALTRAAAAPPQGPNRHLILLTDGMIDLPATGGDKRAQDAASRQRVIDELAPELAAEGVTVHLIALSRNVDLPLLEQVAQTTGGLAAVADTPDQLLRAFLDVLDRILPGDQVPIDAQQRFTIDDDIQAFNALLFHAPNADSPVLIAPDGQRYSRDDHPGRVEWQSSDRYDLIKVPEPMSGEWRIEGAIGDDSRVGIQADIALRSTALPATLYRGFTTPLDVWLEAKGQRLEGDALPAGLAVRAELRDLDGNLLSQTTLSPQAGHFRGELPGAEQLGNARLVITARSERLIRQRVQTVNVVAALSAELSQDGSRIVIRANHPELNADNTRLSAELTGSPLTVERIDARTWAIEVPRTDPNASLPVTISAEADLDGRTWHFDLPIVRLNPEAGVGLTGADLSRAVKSQQREQDDSLGSGSDDSFTDGLSASQMADAAVAKAREGWQVARPYVERYAQRPVTWGVIALLVLLLLLERWRRAVSRRRRARRSEPSL
ncbi:vWA domain-containing protein [Salinicola sp. DM10]|uniref:VWA domain-containing protein n=1 Tax=Salinicola sp. DM10 TaxID=2815721 RepID=UPI001A8EA665|nr:vWA domain-containing protein [Salinicola sp. DM10]MCE3027628.1 VWA domain-containing protein [Salinicola sp. DM10]